MAEPTFEQMLDRITLAMDLIEAVPEDVYPLIDDYLSDAFNSLDDAACSLSSAIDYIESFRLESEAHQDAAKDTA